MTKLTTAQEKVMQYITRFHFDGDGFYPGKDAKTNACKALVKKGLLKDTTYQFHGIEIKRFAITPAGKDWLAAQQPAQETSASVDKPAENTAKVQLYNAIRHAMKYYSNLGEIVNAAEKFSHYNFERSLVLEYTDYFQILQNQLGRVPTDAEVDTWANDPDLHPDATPIVIGEIPDVTADPIGHALAWGKQRAAELPEVNNIDDLRAYFAKFPDTRTPEQKLAALNVRSGSQHETTEYEDYKAQWGIH